MSVNLLPGGDPFVPGPWHLVNGAVIADGKLSMTGPGSGTAVAQQFDVGILSKVGKPYTFAVELRAGDLAQAQLSIQLTNGSTTIAHALVSATPELPLFTAAVSGEVFSAGDPVGVRIQVTDPGVWVLHRAGLFEGHNAWPRV